MMQTQSLPAFKGSQVPKKLPDINNIRRKTTREYLPKGEFLYDEILWPVLLPEEELDPKMMRRIFDVANQASSMSSRLFVVRYDLHMREYQSDNRVIELFHKQLFKALKKRYPKSFISYIWVRERNESEAQHYHYALMLDGNCIRHPDKLTKIVCQCWYQVAGGTIWVPDNCYYDVKKHDFDGYGKLMCRLSYFGKRRTKEAISECKKRFGCGLRKPKKKNEPQVVTTVVSSDLDVLKPSEIDLKTEVRTEEAGLPNHSFRPGKLESLFLGKTRLESLKPPAMPKKRDAMDDLINLSLNLYKQNQHKYFKRLFDDERPDWEWHRQNYLFEVMSNGISLSEYAKKYKLKLRRVYANFRRLGGQSLRMLHWAWHRRCYHQSQLSVDEYILRNDLKGKSVSRQLKRLPMSEYWKQHFHHYYQYFWPAGWTVSAYCEVHNVYVSTARRYLVDFPKTCLFNPLILEPWL